MGFLIKFPSHRRDVSFWWGLSTIFFPHISSSTLPVHSLTPHLEASICSLCSFHFCMFPSLTDLRFTENTNEIFMVLLLNFHNLITYAFLWRLFLRIAVLHLMSSVYSPLIETLLLRYLNVFIYPVNIHLSCEISKYHYFCLSPVHFYVQFIKSHLITSR